MGSVLKFEKKKQLNTGLVIFLFSMIFVYLVITIIMYIMAPRVISYEVRQGTLLKDRAYRGLALREESVIYSDTDGYLNYVVQENSKIKVGSKIYTLSSDALDFSEEAEESDIVLESYERYAVLMKIRDFQDSFKNSHFSSVYAMKNEINTTLSGHSNNNKLNQLEMLEDSGQLSGISIFTSENDGIISYCIDGMEELTKESVTIEHLTKTNYKKVEGTNNTKIKIGDPVYKLVTSDTWTLFIELDKETAKLLENETYVKVNFTKDSQQIGASFELEELEGRYVGYLTFKDSMIRYINDRYLDVELILEDKTGLKIPKSAETQKNFFVIPKSYITQGGNTNDDGVIRQIKNIEGNTVDVFEAVTIYFEEEDVVYLSPEVFKEGDVILKPESRETLVIKEMRPLKGVFCINKGYAAFKQIKILCENNSYYIVEEGNRYGLSNYDHIALHSENLKENDIVF